MQQVRDERMRKRAEEEQQKIRRERKIQKSSQKFKNELLKPRSVKTVTVELNEWRPRVVKEEPTDCAFVDLKLLRIQQHNQKIVHSKFLVEFKALNLPSFCTLTDFTSALHALKMLPAQPSTAPKEQETRLIRTAFESCLSGDGQGSVAPREKVFGLMQ